MDIFKNRPLAFTLLIFLSVLLISLFISPVIKIALSCVAVLSFIISLVIRKSFDNITGAFFAFSFALIFSFVCFDVIYVNYPIDETVHSGNFEVYDVIYKSEETVFFNAKVKELDGEKCSFKCNFVYNSAKIDINEGDILSGEFEFCEFESGNNSFDEKSYYASLGIYNGAFIDKDNDIKKIGNNKNLIKSAFDSIKNYCAACFEEYTSENSASLLTSLTTGDKSMLSDSVKRDFSRLGISHMLAISGMHLAIIMNCIGIFTDLFNFSKRNNSIFIIAICVFYILLTGASASILRSGLMLIIMHLAYFVKRSGDSLTSLFLAVSLIVLLSPSSIYDIGLILSFTATFGIIVITPPFIKYANEHKGKLKSLVNVVMISVVTTLAALTFSLIPVLIYFDEFSLISVLSNLLLNIFITAILTLIPIFLMLSWFEVFALGIGFALDITAGVFLDIVKYISGFENITLSSRYPFVAFTVIVYLSGMLIAVFSKKRSLFLVSYACWFLVFSLSGGIYNLTIKDPRFLYSSINGNDAILMRTSKETVYFDFGNISKGSTDMGFYLLNSELYSSELDAWVIGAYTDNTKITIQKFLKSEFISVIYLPVPSDEVETVTAEEILYYADKECTSVEFFEYDKSFNVCGAKVYITAPLPDTANKIYSAYIGHNGKNTAYYSLGYFESAKGVFDSENVFFGGGGSMRKQTVVPVINCEMLIYSDKNTDSYTNINAQKRICLNENYVFYKE